MILGLITWMLAIGIKESSRVNNAIVVLKLVVLALFVGVGFFYIDPSNWQPFAPNGWKGIHQGAAIVFFAYIGFDAISTAAEETKNPQRNMPIGILGALGICTLIYAVVGLVATGIVPYQELKGSDPLARAFEVRGVAWMHLILALGAVISMTAVLLVFQLGQTRIFFSMSRDGLLPAWFRRIHPRFGTPFGSTIWTGVLVAIGSCILDDDETYDLTNIGTLFAFLVVCLGVLALRLKDPDRPRPFRVPAVLVRGAAGSGRVRLRDGGLADRPPGIASGSGWRSGVVVYFFYGYRHSKLRDQPQPRELHQPETSTRSAQERGSLRVSSSARTRVAWSASGRAR